MPFYVRVGPRGILFRVGTICTGVMGSVSYWRSNRHHRPSIRTVVIDRREEGKNDERRTRR
jgi:hypothetical protein